MKQKPVTLYFTHNQDDPESPYWEQHETKEDAVSHVGNGAEVYSATLKYLGQFKRETKLVKIKKRKIKK